MRVFKENMKLRSFNAWGKGLDTKNIILDNNKGDDFGFLIEDLYPDGISEIELNDFLWFEEDFIFENLNINI